jgi:Spy/CpxP family protein refolding chaperone
MRAPAAAAGGAGNMIRRTLFVGLALAALAFAQGKKGGGGGANMPEIPMAGNTNRMDRFSEILKLDKDEKKQVRTIMDDAQKEAMPVRDQMEKGRLALAQAAAGGKQEEIDAAAKTYAAAESQMAGIEMNAFAKIYQALDKEQQTKSPQIFAMFPGIFKGKNWTEAAER